MKRFVTKENDYIEYACPDGYWKEMHDKENKIAELEERIKELTKYINNLQKKYYDLRKLVVYPAGNFWPSATKADSNGSVVNKLNEIIRLINGNGGSK